MKLRMCEGQVGTVRRGAQRDLNTRLAWIFQAAFPAPAHDDPLRRVDFEKLTAALVFGAAQRPEAQAIEASDPRISLRDQHRSRIGAPPLRDALGGCDGIEDDLRPRLNAPYQRETRHRRAFVRASASLITAPVSRPAFRPTI